MKHNLLKLANWNRLHYKVINSTCHYRGIRIRSSGSRKFDKSSVSSEGGELAKSRVPEFYPNLLVLPITQKPLFPNGVSSFVVKDPHVAATITQLFSSGQPYLGAFLTKDEDYNNDTVDNMDDINKIGVFAQITRVDQGSDGDMTATIFPHRRIRLVEFIDPPSLFQPFPSTKETSEKLEIDFKKVTYGRVENLYDQPYARKNPVVKALTSEILSVLKDLLRYNPAIKEQITAFSYVSGISLVDDPSMLADFAASIVPYGDSLEFQAILESLVIEERLQKSLVLLKKELANAKLQHQINKEVEEKMAKSRKEYYLLEHMKGIQKELGLESDGREKLVETFKSKASKLKMPESAKKVFDEEILKFQTLEPAAMEFNVSRNYLDWITSIPWGKTSHDNLDLRQARSVLDSEHYGMKDVKERILEFVAVGKLNQSIQGKILCLSGPPGVGKTSIGRSVAKALGREFYRFSVGGLSDVSEIKGHRRTYVGAMPGKIVQALKTVNVENPLILIDEIDKIGRSSYRGDPSSALLEVLDPEQNKTFMDHFMDIPIDLSKTLFLCTANVLDTIPGPLLDRMEVIELSGYIFEEKIAIANQYLCPSALESSGLSKDQIELTDSAMKDLLNYYCRESGVRNLKKKIEKIYRKSALITMRNKYQKVTVSSNNLKDFVGDRIFSDEKAFQNPPPGVVMGLAWTGMGGTSLFVESLPYNVGKSENNEDAVGSLKQTGQLGSVMKESMSIAYTYAKSFLLSIDPSNDFFERSSIHLHVPEGATPKDGPSAGVTMCSSLISLALNQSVQNIAMTGELTLSGQILKIGGVKEKILAAKRSGVTRVIFPESNRPDYDELDEGITEGINVDFVTTYPEIFDILFKK